MVKQTCDCTTSMLNEHPEIYLFHAQATVICIHKFSIVWWRPLNIYYVLQKPHCFDADVGVKKNHERIWKTEFEIDWRTLMMMNLKSPKKCDKRAKGFSFPIIQSYSLKLIKQKKPDTSSFWNLKKSFDKNF